MRLETFDGNAPAISGIWPVRVNSGAGFVTARSTAYRVAAGMTMGRDLSPVRGVRLQSPSEPCDTHVPVQGIFDARWPAAVRPEAKTRHGATLIRTVAARDTNSPSAGSVAAYRPVPYPFA